MRRSTVYLVGLLASLAVLPAAHAEPSTLVFGPEVQIYPAGVIVTANGQLRVAERDGLTFRVGYNATDRRDFGEHDDEQGGGPGLGVGYLHFFKPERRGWLIGARLDVWDLEIDWMDDPPGMPGQRGTTDVVVLQPTAEGGYAFRLGSRWRVDATLSLGAEINVSTRGDDVGEGAILLAGARFVYRF